MPVEKGTKRTYHCSGQAAFHLTVRAESLAEATRMIDDVLEEADVVAFVAEEDELTADKGQVSRGRIQVEQ